MPKSKKQFCAICRTNKSKRRMYTLKCGHKHCRGCTRRWAQCNNTCPQCRATFYMPGVHRMSTFENRIIVHGTMRVMNFTEFALEYCDNEMIQMVVEDCNDQAFNERLTNILIKFIKESSHDNDTGAVKKYTDAVNNLTMLSILQTQNELLQ